MKKILFVALGATLLAAGCQKTEIINQVNPDGKMSMTFSTGISKLTKSATDPGKTNLENQGFVLSVVSAYEDVHNGTKTEFNDYYDELENVAWSYKNNEWAISTGNSYFWPGKDRDLVFFAVSSAQKGTDGKQKFLVPELGPNESDFGISGTPGEDGICDAVTVKNFVIKNYTVVAPDYSSNVESPVLGADDDLMVADVVIQDQDETPVNGAKGRVDLFFNHTLSKVEFVFSTKSETATAFPVVVNSVVIEDVVTTADLNVTVDLSNRISENKYVWGTNDQGKSYVLEATDANSTDFNVDYDLALDATEKTYSTWLVIPQDLKDKMVSITYTITDASNDGSKPTTFTSVWPLAATGIVDAWDINNYVKYKVTLAPNIITFNPVLEKDWNNEVYVDPSTGDVVYTVKIAGTPQQTLYYKGTLEVGTVIYTDSNLTAVAASGEYTLTDGKTLTVADEGKVAKITVPEDDTTSGEENGGSTDNNQ